MKTSSKLPIFVGLCASLLAWCAPIHAADPDGPALAAMFRSTEIGNATSALKLGRMYETGSGGVAGRSMEAAVYWYTRAATIPETAPTKDMVYNNQQAMDASHRLGFIYEYGDQGIPKDIKVAVRWYRRAAEKGYYPSQYNLGAMYAQGMVAPANDVEGYMWLLLAQRQTDGCTYDPQCRFVTNDPPGNVKRLLARMTPEQVAQAEKLAEDWKPLPLWVPARD